MDPRRRPRAIVTAGMLLIALIIVTVGSLVGTSFEWFCTTPCHVVHDDNTAAYRVSSHTNVSCMACHEPVNASPLVLVALKIHVLPDVPATIFGTYHAPNLGNHVAMAMPSEQCTQCHDLSSRKYSPSDGIEIDHAVHMERDITCTTCHNRVAHPEASLETLVVRDNRKKDDWMQMDACFRCHSLEDEAEAPGDCLACHTEDFELVPASHDTGDWYNRFGASAGHAQAALDASASIEAAKARNAEEKPMDPKKAKGPILMASSEVNTCYTCHKTSFCSDCHGLQMPHPAEFKTNHGPQGNASPVTCANCHARSAAEAKGTQFCNACHHPASTSEAQWLYNHAPEVNKNGAEPCFQCHQPEECSACHVTAAIEGRVR
jgi:hypothetical protein